MKKQIMSIAAIAAIFTTGVSAYDMKTNGTIIDDVRAPVQKNATYTDGVNATEDLNLSTNRQGNALIYPAFRSSGGWKTEISVRNTQDVAIIAKAVLYAQDDSRELFDFNIYLSPHDAAKFTIQDNKVSSKDGSIAAQVKNPDGLVALDDVKFADKADFNPAFNSKAEGGYVIIYAMMQENSATTSKVYHLKHKELFKDYRKTLDVCRELDQNTSTAANWRNIFKLGALATDVSNGTAIAAKSILAPNQLDTCSNDATLFTGAWKRKDDATFTSPKADALFGEVEISHDSDKRSLLLPATALSNYVENGKVMLWAEGEYAAIQDRRINDTIYDTAGIKKDAKTFEVKQTFYTFEKKTGDTNEATLLLTQPMKRALQMANQGGAYWDSLNISAGNWGKFQISRTPWTDDEGTKEAEDPDEIEFVSLNSPLDGETPKEEEVISYKSEITTLKYDTLTAGFDNVFKDGALAGYIDIKIGADRNNPATPVKYLPAIVTEMSSTNINGEAQINWIYSATN